MNYLKLPTNNNPIIFIIYKKEIQIYLIYNKGQKTVQAKNIIRWIELKKYIGYINRFKMCKS